MNRIVCSAILAGCCLSFANVSLAQGYLGGSVGVTKVDEEGFEDDNGFKITGGYKFNKNFALEASYVDLGEFQAEDEVVEVIEYLVGESLREVSVDITGIELSAVGFAPVSDNAAFFARVGIFKWDADVRVETTWYGSGTSTEDGSDPFLGAGFYFDISDRLAFKAEYIRYDAFEGDVDFIGAGLNIKF